MESPQKFQESLLSLEEANYLRTCEFFDVKHVLTLDSIEDTDDRTILTITVAFENPRTISRDFFAFEYLIKSLKSEFEFSSLTPSLPPTSFERTKSTIFADVYFDYIQKLLDRITSWPILFISASLTDFLSTPLISLKDKANFIKSDEMIYLSTLEDKAYTAGQIAKNEILSFGNKFMSLVSKSPQETKNSPILSSDLSDLIDLKKELDNIRENTIRYSKNLAKMGQTLATLSHDCLGTAQAMNKFSVSLANTNRDGVTLSAAALGQNSVALNTFVEQVEGGVRLPLLDLLDLIDQADNILRKRQVQIEKKEPITVSYETISQAVEIIRCELNNSQARSTAIFIGVSCMLSENMKEHWEHVYNNT